MEFDWDPGKRQYLLDDRAIDFEDMLQLFDGRPRLTLPSPRDGEDRYLSIAEIDGKCFVVVWMWRDETIWLISARRARKKEAQWYYQALERGA